MMPSEKAFIAHANDDIRCEKQEPPPEDINQAKMELIDSSWGASWEEIYGILFPGAPIPSPCRYPLVVLDASLSCLIHPDADYEADIQDPRKNALGLSGSLGFEDFEAYARRELPQMLEARLWAQMNTNRAPIAEALRALLAEILPSCQSMVAENFRSIRGLGTEAPMIEQGSSSSGIHPVPSGADALLGDWELPIPSTAQRPSDFVPQPPHVDIGGVVPNGQSKHGTGSQRNDQGHAAYFAYGAPMLSCICACHDNHDVDPPFDGVPVGKDCGYCHADHLVSPSFGFDHLFDLPDI